MNIIKKIIPNRLKKYLKSCLGIKSVTRTKKEYIVKISEKKKFNGKIAIVTGGYGAIGRSICIRLAIEGALVYVAGRKSEKIDDIIDEIKLLGFDAKPLILDINKMSEIESAFNKVFLSEGKIDILVNCAGGSAREHAQLLFHQSHEIIKNVIETNLLGSLFCSKVGSEYMIKNHSGSIINISSAIGLRGKAKFTDYAAAKAGIIGYTSSLAIELGQYGITVNCISPGFIQRNDYDKNTESWLLKTNYLNRIGTVEDVSSAVAFIASDEAVFITGQNLFVDGGRTLGLHGDN